MLYVLFFFRGVFGSTANTLSNAYVADIFERRREFYVGLYHALAAGAAVIGPYLALSLVNDFAMSFGVTALIIGASAALFWFGMRHEIKKPMVQNRANFGGFGKLFRMLRIKNMALILLLILFASFIQNIVVLYISSYGMEIGTQADGAFLLAMFLGGLFAGSLLYSIVAHKFSTIQIMIYANIVSFGALVAMLLCSGSLTIGMLSLAGGVFFGANMPGLFVELAKMVPEDSGAVSAFLFLGNIIAGLAAPVMVGAIADEIGMRWALMISMVFFVPILLLLLVWKRRHGGLLAADADLKRTVNVVE